MAITGTRPTGYALLTDRDFAGQYFVELGLVELVAAANAASTIG
jgi:hypothetical protein